MVARLERLEIEGFTSIVEASVELGLLNVLVGANGAGKSNLIRVLEMLGRIVDEDLRLFVAANGRAPALINATQQTRMVRLSLHGRDGTDAVGYEVRLAPGLDDDLFFVDERISFHKPAFESPWRESLDSGHRETKLHATIDAHGRGQATASAVVGLLGCRVYHFHDTSTAASVKHGGVSKWSKVERDVRGLLGDSSLAVLTTLIDYYGFPLDSRYGDPANAGCA